MPVADPDEPTIDILAFCVDLRFRMTTTPGFSFSVGTARSYLSDGAGMSSATGFVGSIRTIAAPPNAEVWMAIKPPCA